MEDHTAYICILSIYPFLVEFFFSLHKAHTFTWPDIFCKVWKRWGDAVPMGKLLFLPVRLRDVNLPISWRTKFGLKVTCLFPCAVEGGWFVRSYKMKQFTRHISASSTVLSEARDVDAIIVTVFFILPGLESQRSLGTNFFIPKMYFVWHARSLQFHVVKQSHAFNMVWPLAANR